jgi:broad specificity phosphatase PhoE
MKWPETLTLVRHDSSAYNVLKPLKDASPLYQEFVKAYEINPDSDISRRLAIEVTDQFSLKCGDHNTPLAEGSGIQAENMAKKLKNIINIPDVIFVSPYERTMATLNKMTQGWPELKDVKTIKEERITEQDHGLALLYSDWRVFNILHPEQRDLYERQGSYRYRYPQGENVPDVRERLRSWLNTVTRDYSGQDVLAVTHHLAILSFRANLERLDENDFLRLDKEEKPINAGVTIYRSKVNEGKDDHLELDVYNAKLY